MLWEKCHCSDSDLGIILVLGLVVLMFPSRIRATPHSDQGTIRCTICKGMVSIPHSGPYKYRFFGKER